MIWPGTFLHSGDSDIVEREQRDQQCDDMTTAHTVHITSWVAYDQYDRWEIMGGISVTVRRFISDLLWSSLLSAITAICHH